MPGQRMRVVDRREDVGLWGLFDDNDFTAVKAELDKLESTVQYGRGEIARFCIEPYGYDGGVELHLYIYRDETDAEYEARIAKEEAAKEKSRLARERRKEKARQVLMDTEAAERAEYERLRAKFDAA